MELRVEYEWEDVPMEPTSAALANLKEVIGCTCTDIPDIAWNEQYYCIRCRASDGEIDREIDGSKRNVDGEIDGSNRQGSK